MRIVLSGAPGTGKSSVFRKIHYIDKIPEVARGWLTLISSEALNKSYDRDFVQNLIEITEIKNWIENTHGIFDRGLVDEVAYRRFFDMEVSEELKERCRKYRYDKMFLFPYWQEIYQTDDVRQESKEEAILIHHLIVEAYTEFGYELIEVPKVSLRERLLFIQEQCGELFTL